MTDDPRLNAAIEKALALQREVVEQHKLLAHAMDPVAEERLATLMAQRGPAFEAIGRRLVERMLTGDTFALTEPAPTIVAQVTVEQAPVESAAPIAPMPEAPAVGGEELAALTGQKLAPAWTRQPAPAPSATLDIDVLAALLQQIGETPRLLSVEDLRHETEHIEFITSELGTWRKFPRDVQVALLEIMTGRLRGAQDVADRLDGNFMYALDGCFRRMRQYARDAKPGVAYGLARDHAVPGNDWRSWSNGKLADLIRECLPAEEVATPRPRPPPRKAPAVVEEPAADKGVPEDWPHWGSTRGVEAVVVGGETREDRREALEQAFQFGALEWLPGSQPRKCDALVERIAHGGVELVLLLRAFISHKDADKIIHACDAAKVRFVLVDSGYGVTQVRLALERAFEQRRGAA